MASFCRNCGTPLTGAFCGKCGTRADAPSQPAQAAQPASPAGPPQQVAKPAARPSAAQATKSSGLGKVLLIVGGVLLVLCAVGLAGTIYGVHLLKNKVKEKAATYTGGAIGGAETVQVAEGHTCALLPKEELEQVLGVAVERAQEIQEGGKPGCAYYTNPAAFAQLQRMAVEQARKDSAEAAKRPGPKTDNPLELLKDTDKLEGVVKSLGMTQPDKDGRLFGFTIERDFGRDHWGTVRATMSAIPGFEDVPDAGDHAMIGSFGHALYVLKGDSMISLETIYVPDARMRGAEIGRRIASRL